MITRRKLISIVCATILLFALLALIYAHWPGTNRNSADELLAALPSDASAVVYIDVNEFRHSQFLAELYEWVAQPTADPEYLQFIRTTGFNYETDLDHVGVAMLKHGSDLFAIAQGRFDQQKIAKYAAQYGTAVKRKGRQVFSVGLGGTSGRTTFTFLSNDQMALTNAAELEPLLSHPADNSDRDDWHERFRRLAGSPAFVVLRPDASESSPLEPGSSSRLQSPELMGLLRQLRWVTIAAKPSADRLRIICEAESATETTARQLSEVLNGLLTLAQTGLNDPKVRQQLDPQVRIAYLQVLKSSDVSRIDRGETKSVRLIFDVTTQFLQAARTAPSLVPAKPRSSTAKSTIRN